MNKQNHGALVSTYIVVVVLVIFLVIVIRWSYAYKALSTDTGAATQSNEMGNEQTGETDNEDKKDLVNSAVGVVCWGDSLTQGIAGGYPQVLEDNLKSDGVNIPVENKGVCGEGTIAIMNRAGAITSYLSKDIVIPSEVEGVSFNAIDEDGNYYDGFPCGRNSSCLISIKGVQGKVVERSSGGNSYYQFTRLYSGEEVEVDKGTKIGYDYMNQYANYIPVIFIGTNGGWSSIDELIEQQQKILDVFPENDQYIIIGLTYQKRVEFDDLDEAMEEQWGEHYINLREYFTGQGIYDAGLTPSSSDLAQMKEGIVPDIIRSDYVHYTKSGYTALGELLFERMKELHYIN